MISYKEVPGTYLHCIYADCPMANHCLRQLAMQSLPNDYNAVRIVNPNVTKPSADCKFYRSDAPQVYGRGFKNMKSRCYQVSMKLFRIDFRESLVAQAISSVVGESASVRLAKFWK